MVILAGLAAGCLHLAGRGRWGLLESGGERHGADGGRHGPFIQCHLRRSFAAPQAPRHSEFKLPPPPDLAGD